MIKKIFSALVVVLFATSMMAQSGLTCEDAIPVDSTYRGTVDGPCELWYTAGTYDLPLHVYFSPNSLDSEMSPEVVVDLTCTPGVYDDPKVDSLLTMVSDFGLEFPVEFWCDKVIRNGKVEWDLSINQSYRDQLSEFGITYNVPAYVKVRFYEGGTIRMTPDTAFTSCMDNAHYILLDDSIDILADESERAFVVPYADWQNDSIRFVWTGEQPAQIYLATTKCDFAIDGGYVWDSFEVTSETPYKLYSSQMKDAIKNQQGGGIFYGKIVSSTPGKLVVEKIPMSQAQGGAVMMTYGQSINLKANDNTLYCFPRTWSATQFLSSAQAAVSMYVSSQPDFTPSVDDANVLAGYEFEYEEGQRVLYLSNADLAPVLSQLSGDYVYVRFSASAATAITPSAWTASRCVVNSVMIHPNKTFTITNNSNTVYRFKYADYEGYGFVLKWANTLTTLPTYIADTCTFGLTTGDKHVIRYGNIREGKQMTIKSDVYAEWASRVDAEGYLYVRFNADRGGEVTFVTDKPADVPITPDPVYTTIDATLCYGEVYEWNGQTYTATGEYTQTLVAANGADSIVTLKLTIRPEVAAVEEKATVCYGESYTWQGTTYTETGEYSTTLQDENGCDYQAVLNLTVLPEVAAVEEKDTVCYGESYTWQGATYTETGEYSTTLQDENGCDYQAVLNLTVLPEVAATTETVEVPFGETYTWHGTTYAESGSYTITLQDENGCDYQATLHLTVLPEPEKTDLLPNDALSVSLPTALNVYAMDYAAWKAQDVKWQWTGSTPLYVFVAKSSDYALTPQNRHVLLFAPIEPGEEIVLTKEQVSAWESLAEGGMIYVRLLTEKSGQLTTVAE